ncbi:MAG: DUF1800 domain-containing protein [bacterium]|nr:DUF1800 domain-containing protein [bacterium]
MSEPAASHDGDVRVEEKCCLMVVNRRTFLRTSAAAGLGALAAHWLPQTAAAQADTFTEVSISPELHIVNRVTWGARPQDIARINEMGSAAYIDWQLAYEAIPDPQVEAFIAARRALHMNRADLEALVQAQYSSVLQAALAARLYRAVTSERQLYERMVEFWTDHFNVPILDYVADKIIEDRDVIRRHALGSFRDLLFGTARSAAMLQYLDNASSSAEHPNENYARELLELHTLGVDGGYTETDVNEVARAFTGWTLNFNQPDPFVFSAYDHDTRTKTVLGVTLVEGRGIEDGLEVLDMLANHPSTARFISTKLIRRFVSDLPPESLIDSTSAVFIETGGDLRSVMRHILNSGEFTGSHGQKFRRPFDFLVAAARALEPGIQIGSPESLVYRLEPLGQVPYHWGPPNGYPDAAGAWINTNGLLHRWNLALDLANASEGYVSGVALHLEAVVPPQATVGALIDTAAERLLGHGLPDADRALLAAYITRSGSLEEGINADTYYEKAPGLIGLVLASPYFQWI